MTKPTRRNRGEILPSPERRGLDHVESATYVGVSVGLFDEMVRDGRLPPAMAIGGRRLLWDRVQLDKAIDRLAVTDNPGAPADKYWERALKK